MDRSRGYSLTQHPDPELYCLGHLVEEFDFHAGAKGIDEKGHGELEDVTRRMVRLEVPAWREPVTATLIPYFAWANRGENEMTVWLRG